MDGEGKPARERQRKQSCDGVLHSKFYVLAVVKEEHRLDSQSAQAIKPRYKFNLEMHVYMSSKMYVHNRPV
jgi:hypothetical protein